MKFEKSQILGVADALGQMIIYLSHDKEENAIISVITSDVLIIYTSIECEWLLW